MACRIVKDKSIITIFTELERVRTTNSYFNLVRLVRATSNLPMRLLALRML